MVSQQVTSIKAPSSRAIISIRWKLLAEAKEIRYGIPLIPANSRKIPQIPVNPRKINKSNKKQARRTSPGSQSPSAWSGMPLINSIFNFHRNRLFQSELTAHGPGISALSLGHVDGDRSARLLEIVAVEAVLLVPGQIPGRCQ